MFSANQMEKRLQTAGLILIPGLLIEAVCLLSDQPLAFIIFACAGGLLLFGAIALYLFSLVSTSVEPSKQ